MRQAHRFSAGGPLGGKSKQAVGDSHPVVQWLKFYKRMQRLAHDRRRITDILPAQPCRLMQKAPEAKESP
jgi:hypothetical protein